MPRQHSVAHLHLHFRVRPLLLRFLVNAVTLALTAIVVPHIFFSGDYRILSWLLISAIFGLVNSFLKPLVQIVMLPFIFVSYGLVIVLINTLSLWVLALIFANRFQVERIFWGLVGGLVCGLLAGFFENMFGLSPPILEGGPEAVKEAIARRKQGSLEAQLLDVAAKASPEAPEDAASGPGVDMPDGGES